jgi:Protein of unknown function (DUF1565).
MFSDYNKGFPTIRRRLFILLATFSVGFFVVTSAHAATYYVATNGSDSNPGTQAAPWKTMQKAFDSVKGGDTVNFMAGTYRGGARAVNLHPAAGQWITFKPYEGAKVRIDSSAGNAGIRISGASYLIIEGFEITNSKYNYSLPNSCDLTTSTACQNVAKNLQYSNPGIMVDSTTHKNATTDTHHLIIRNNNIHHNIGGGIAGGEGPSPGIAGSYDWQILNNQIHNNGYAGLSPGYGTYIEGSRFIVSGNILHNNSGNNMRIGNIVERHHAVDFIIENNVSYSARGPFWHFSSGKVFTDNWGYVLYGMKGGIFRNNISYGNWGDGLWSVSVDPSKPTMIYNNTIYGNGGQGMILSGNSVGKNNIIYGNGKRIQAYEVDLTKTHTGAFEYNLVGGGSLQVKNGGSGTESNNIKNSDPKFVNAAAGDFGLQAGSPALDKGMTLAQVTTDFTGKARPEGAAYDIGAFEGAGSKADVLPGAPAAGFPAGGGGGRVIPGIGNCFH